VYVFLGNGNGTFTAAAQQLRNCSILVAGDFTAMANSISRSQTLAMTQVLILLGATATELHARCFVGVGARTDDPPASQSAILTETANSTFAVGVTAAPL